MFPFFIFYIFSHTENIMSVYSMTGYASAQTQATASSESATAGGSSGASFSAGLPTVRLGLEVRSVNSRFLDVAFRLPDDLRQHEPALRDLIQTHCKRGKLELRANLDSSAASTVAEPTPRLLQRLAMVQDKVQGWLPEATALSVAEVIRLSVGDTTETRDWGPDLMALAATVIQELLEARRREGERLAIMLHERLASLRTLVLQATPLVPQLMEQQRQRFLDRWKEALGLADSQGLPNTLPDAARERALTEAAAFAIRVDVAEELTRLGSHLDEIGRLLTKGGELGKRLDFLIQELHREANTLGSKSAVLEMTRISVDMKVLIEQMREQVQNIE